MPDSKARPLPWAIQTSHITKQYPPNKRWMGILPANKPGTLAVNDVDLQVQQGELFGLLGPNGAGKTTLIKMLATLIVPTSGTALVNGFQLHQEAAIKATVGLVTPDERSFFWRLTGRQNLVFFAALHNLRGQKLAENVESMLAIVGLQDMAEKTFRHYSTGMRQRLSIARALLHNPELLFLDEPTKGLDPLAVQSLHQLIREKLVEKAGVTVFLTTHQLDEAEKLCDQVAIMHQGRILGSGTVPELRKLVGISDHYRLQFGDLGVEQQPEVAQRAGVVIQELDQNLPDQGLIEFTQDDDRLNRVLDAIREAGGHIRALNLVQQSLEQVFTRIVDDGFTPRQTLGSSLLMKTADAEIHSPRVVPFIQVAWAFLKRDWRSEISYRFSFILQFSNILFTIGVFYFVAVVIGDAAAPLLQPYGGNYFAFVLIGLAFANYFNVALSSFARSLRQAQTTGTLEAMLSTPASLPSIVVASSLWSYLFATLQVLAYLLVGIAFPAVTLAGGNFLAAVLLLVLTIVAFSSLGILAASFIMVLKRGDPITWLFNAFSTLLGGVYYPIEVLPDWLKFFSNLLPVTYALHGMRLALLQGASFRELQTDFFALIVFSVILLPLSLLAFRYAVRRARVDGSLTHY